MAMAAATPLLPSKPLPSTLLPVTPPEPGHHIKFLRIQNSGSKSLLTFAPPEARGVCRHPPLMAQEAAGRRSAEEAPGLGAGVSVGHVHRRPGHLSLATQESALHHLLTHVEDIVHLVRLVTLVVMMASVIIVLLMRMASIASAIMGMLLASCQTLDATEERRARCTCGSQCPSLHAGVA